MNVVEMVPATQPGNRRPHQPAGRQGRRIDRQDGAFIRARKMLLKSDSDRGSSSTSARRRDRANRSRIDQPARLARISSRDRADRRWCRRRGVQHNADLVAGKLAETLKPRSSC
jgi:hypothetical protein